MEKNRNYILDIFKIISTVLIVWHHYQQILKIKFDLINFYGGRFYFGWLVEFFFVLSGFFMYEYIDKIKQGLDFKTFYIKRIMRLLPLIGIATIIYEFIIYYYPKVLGTTFMDLKLNFFGTVISILSLQSGWGFDNPRINNPTWYVSVLILCYIIFYYITYKYKEINIVYGYIIMVFLGVGIKNYSINLPFFNPTTARGFYAFFTGLLVAVYLNKYEIKNNIKTLSFIMVIFISFLFIKDYGLINSNTNYTLTFIYFPSLIILSYSKIFENFKFIGGGIKVLSEISFNVYIWHGGFILTAIIITKKFNLPIDLSSYKVMVLLTIILYIYGTISFYFIEKPLRKINIKI